jgi:hypothetical protein
LGKLATHLHHPLEVCIGKNIYTWEPGAGLGWDARASASTIDSDVHNKNCRNCNVMARTFHSLGKLATHLHHPSEVYIGKNIQTCEPVAVLGWDATAFGSVIDPDVQQDL